MGTNYHNEVLRKARILERQRNANPGSEIEVLSTAHAMLVELMYCFYFMQHSTIYT